MTVPIGHRKRVGRLAVCQTLDIDEIYGFPLHFGQVLHLPQHLSGQNIRFSVFQTVENQHCVCVNEPLTLADFPRSDLVQPDRMEDGDQPAVEAGTGFELVGTLQRPDAGRLDQVLGGVAVSGKHQPIAPQARQLRR